MLAQSTAGAAPAPIDLELTRLPSGELAWLRPLGDGFEPGRYGLTQLGQDLVRRWRAERWLFGVELS